MSELSEFHAGAEDAAYAQGYQDGAMATHAKHDAEIERQRARLAEAEALLRKALYFMTEGDDGGCPAGECCGCDEVRLRARIDAFLERKP